MKHSALALRALTGLLLATAAQSASADAETDALRAEVKALEARLAVLEKREQATQAAAVQANMQQPVTQQPAAIAAPATASATTASNQNLSQRIAIVERNQELTQEAIANKAATTPDVYIGSKGFAITSPDKQYSVNVHGYVQADDRSFVDNGSAGHVGVGNTNEFLIRSARPIVDAKMTDFFDARLMMDFGRGATTLLDAYGDFHPVPGNPLFNLRAGEFKSPVGIERWQSEQDILFVERGQTTNLVPYRDIGVMAYGQIIPDQLEYQLGLLNGAADLQANTGDADNGKDVAGRLFAHPFRWASFEPLRGLGFGAGGTYGVHDGTFNAAGSNSALTTGYQTVGQRTFFSYSASDYANGPQWRINPQATYYYGPFSLIGEYVLNDQEITHQATRAGTTDYLKNRAWEGIATYVLSGEDASFYGVKPAHPFNPSQGAWGAFELVGRLSELNVDSKAFPLFADPTVSARNAYEYTAGGTWYMNYSVKLNLDYSYTRFDGGNIRDTDRVPEQVILSRAQFRF